VPSGRDRRGMSLLSGASAAPRAASTSSGFVLLIVLWWLALLMFVGVQIITATHTSVLVSTNIRDSAVAEAQADGAVNEAIFQVLAQRWKADGATHVVQGAQAVAEVRIDDEGARIDPNVAPVALMQALLRQCGATPKRAVTLAEAIAEWRSLDLLQSSGPERGAAYRIAGRDYLPPHTRFVSVDELGLVIGMTPDIVACLVPHVSVYSLAVPSFLATTDPVVRRALMEAYPYETPQPAAASMPDVAVIRITATARLTDRGQFRRVAVIRVIPAEPDEHFVYKILCWEGSAG
jgi:general secretion pathway protein K